METQWPKYYPELKIPVFIDARFFVSDDAAIFDLEENHGTLLMAIIKDDGNGNVTCIREY